MEEGRTTNNNFSAVVAWAFGAPGTLWWACVRGEKKKQIVSSGGSALLTSGQESGTSYHHGSAANGDRSLETMQSTACLAPCTDLLSCAERGRGNRDCNVRGGVGMLDGLGDLVGTARR